MGTVRRIFGKDHDEATKTQLETCVAAEEGAVGVLCADGHLGYSMPIGGVVAYEKHISPSGVGYDIACGNLAVRTEIHFKDLSNEELSKIALEIEKRISFGVGRKNNEPVTDHPVFEKIEKSPVMEQRGLLQLAKNQLGTVGSGNHYVDLLEDEAGFLWIAVHFGSRGFGHKTASGFLNIASGGSFNDRNHDGEMMSAPKLLDIYTPSGADYLSAMNIAGAYAYAGREVVVGTVLDILGKPKVVQSVHNHHNFAWNEVHGGKVYWVVRKGATPAFPNQLGFVGGSMGDICVILKGKDTAVSRDALYSTVHGAGRLMSRTKAAGKWRWVNGTYTQKSPGLIDYTTELNKLDGVIVRGGGADEAPPVYRSLIDVLEAHLHTVEVMTVMRPRVVVMAGNEVFDPYKE